MSKEPPGVPVTVDHQSLRLKLRDGTFISNVYVTSIEARQGSTPMYEFGSSNPRFITEPPEITIEAVFVPEPPMPEIDWDEVNAKVDSIKDRFGKRAA